jgi:hypothetical protein
MPVEQIKYTPGKTIQVRVTAPTRVHGKHYEAGRELELPEQFGLELIAAGKAEKLQAAMSLKSGK